MAFLFAPIFGRWGNVIGAKILYNSGAYIQAVVGITFGFLTYINNTGLFIGLSYLLRALNGIADVAAWSAVVSILMKLYPTRVAQIMSWTEMFFGLGYMLGPALGSLLYEAGGFLLPFVSVGAFGFVVRFKIKFKIPAEVIISYFVQIATCLVFAIPNVKSDGPLRKSSSEASENQLTFRKLIRVRLGRVLFLCVYNSKFRFPVPLDLPTLRRQHHLLLRQRDGHGHDGASPDLGRSNSVRGEHLVRHLRGVLRSGHTLGRIRKLLGKDTKIQFWCHTNNTVPRSATSSPIPPSSPSSATASW